jgi:hypothetical protein
MWLRARRRIGGLLKGVLEEVMGSQKIFTISELGDRADLFSKPLLDRAGSKLRTTKTGSGKRRKSP